MNCGAKKRVWRTSIIFLMVAVLLSACTSSTTQPFPMASNDASTLAWKKCYGKFQCATLKVPIDYIDNSLGTFDIAVLRYRDANQRNRIGSLVLNPGGPGASGIEYARNAEFIINPDVLERYDIVGFDPRGVGKSSPIHCLNRTEQDASFAGDPKPDNGAEFQQGLKESQEFIEKCLSRTPFLENYTTANTARDMELLRQALGDEKLNYMGLSYGTYLGTLYAQQFPQNVGRFVLDGAVNPTISIEEQSVVQAAGFDQALVEFIADCSTQKDCPLPTDATPEFFTDLFNRVSAKPLAITHGKTIRSITEGLVVIGVVSALYDDASGWPQLRIAIAQALQGDGSTFANLADAYHGRLSDGTYIDNQNDANAIIECLDWPHKKSNSEIRSSVQRYTTAAPVFGPYVAYSGITCNLLNKALDRTQISTDQNYLQIENTATSILIIGTTQDPATPYSGAVALSKYIKSSRLITFQGEGHTGYGRGSACVDGAVDKYFTKGVIPTKNLICRSNS